MRKHMFGVLLLLASLTVASVSFASTVMPLDGTSIGVQSFRPSNNVNVTVASAPGDLANVGGYSVTGNHTSGDRDFATNSESSKIYWQNKSGTAVTVTVTPAPGKPTLVPDLSGWTSM